MIPSTNDAVICQNLSACLSECLVAVHEQTKVQDGSQEYLDNDTAAKVAKAQGGAQSNSVTLVEYPMVAISVGK